MKLKKYVSGLVAGAMMFSMMPTSALAWNAKDDAWTSASSDGVAARFFVGSDTHIGRSNADTKTANALDVFNTVDASANGVLLVGDVTDSGNQSQYNTLMGIINNSPLSSKIVLSMGNHEYSSASTGNMAGFEAQTGQKANEVIFYFNDGTQKTLTDIKASQSLQVAGFAVEMDSSLEDEINGNKEEDSLVQENNVSNENELENITLEDITLEDNTSDDNTLADDDSTSEDSSVDSSEEQDTNDSFDETLIKEESTSSQESTSSDVSKESTTTKVNEAIDGPRAIAEPVAVASSNLVDELDGLVATVVKMSAKNYSGDYTDQYDMLKEALELSDAVDSNIPVLVMGHHGIKNTAYVTNEWYGTYGEGTAKNMSALMSNYSQAIHFSGHSHATLEDSRSIFQDAGYTVIQTSTIGAYFENESGKINPTTGSYSSYPENPEVSSQALRVDIMENGTVEVYRMDLTHGKYMFEDEPWTFSSTDLPYTADRVNESDAPSFEQDAEVTAKISGSNAAIVTFPAAKPASDDNVDMIHSYKVTLKDVNSGQTIVRSTFADYYIDPQKEQWSVKITDLNASTTYEVSVQAVTSYSVASEAITANEYLVVSDGPTVVYPAQAVLDIDFARDDNGADANGHTLTVFGQPTFKYDEELERTVAAFDGVDDGLRYTWTSEDLDKFTKNFTVEIFYKPNDQKNNDPLGTTQSAGFCFEQKGGTNDVQFWAHIGGSYKKPTATVELGKWNHLVGTYDGSSVKIYLNGVLQDSVSASGTLTTPPLYLFLGADTTSGGDSEYLADCEIAMAKVYTGTMTSNDVQDAYNKATGQTEETENVVKTIFDVDFSREDNGADANGHELTVVGEPEFSYVEEMKRTVASFDGVDDGLRYTWDESDFEKDIKNFSVEVYYKPNDTNNNNVLGSAQSSGFCLEQASGSNELEFWAHIGGSYKIPKASVTMGEWNHVVGTYDGENVNLYINGELKASVAAEGNLTTPPGYIFIGGDTKANGSLEFPGNVDVALAKVYTGSMSAEEVVEAYNTATTVDKDEEENKEEENNGENNNSGNNSGGSGSGGSSSSSSSSSATTTQTEIIDNETPLSESPILFTDINSSDWFYESVVFAYNQGIMRGTKETTFSPNEVTTRGMIVAILYALEDSPQVGASQFTDVTVDKYYANAVSWAAQNGIVSGYGNGIFGAEDEITREQLAVILKGYASLKGYVISEGADLTSYSDLSLVSEYAVDAMAWAKGAGLISGTSETTLSPQGLATRAQVATIMAGFIQNVAVEQTETTEAV